MIEPPSWMSQDALGSPQKLGPCGDEGGGHPTEIVTPYQSGETISVTIHEVVPHPGHYRVALAVDDRSELPPEPVVTTSGFDPCASAAIQDPPIFPVLADNLLPHNQAFDGPRTFTVTLPSDVTCTRCTLQVLEFMSSHGAPCFYHHCADISISAPAAPCGNGGVDSGEQCDDGNRADGDGCDATCRLECAPLVRSRLVLGRLGSATRTDHLRLEAEMMLPATPSSMLAPGMDGIRLLIADDAATRFDISLPGGSGWLSNDRQTKWAYRNATANPPGGIYKVVISERAAAIPGLIKLTAYAKGTSLAPATANLPLTVTVSVAPQHCGRQRFSGCSFNATSSKLTCR